MTVTIADASGGVVKSLSLGAQKAGTASYDWDGKTDDGKTAGSGPFTISVSANNGSAAVTSRSLVLTVAGLGQVQLSAVRAVG